MPLRVIVPVTDWKERYVTADWMVKLVPDHSNNLSKDSTADCFQVKSLSTDRFVKNIGTISDADYEKVKAALKNVLDLN